MSNTARRLTAMLLTVLLGLFAAFPASAASRQTPCDAVTMAQQWEENIADTLRIEKITCLNRLSDEDVDGISDRLSKQSKVYLVELSDGRYTYYIVLDLRTDDAAYLRNLGVMRKTSHKLYDRSERMAAREKRRAPVLMDYTHIVGELSAHYIVYRVTDALGGASLTGLLGKLYRSASVAELNIDESRMAVLLRILGLLIGE